MASIRLTEGDDTYVYTRGDTEDTVFGLGGNDALAVATDYSQNFRGTVTLDGGEGDDVLTPDNYLAVLIGGLGNDVGQLPFSNAANQLRLSTDAQGRYVIHNFLYSTISDYTIDPTVESVHFINAGYSYYGSPPSEVAYADLPKFVGAQVILAGITNTTPQHIFGVIGAVDTLYSNGNAYDYTYSQSRSFVDPTTGQARAGDITLTATNGSGVYTLSSQIDYIHFLFGQTVAFSDLASTEKPTPVTPVDETLYAGITEDKIVLGGTGSDTLVMHGALKDYVIKSITAYAADALDTDVSHGQAVDGLALIATNGSGIYVVDPSTERVQFLNDGAVDYGDLTNRAAAAPSSFTGDMLHMAVSGENYGLIVFGGDGYNDRALISSVGGLLFFSRLTNGNFAIGGFDGDNDHRDLVIEQSIETVQLSPSGPAFALADLPQHMGGDPTFTRGTDANDILFNKSGGDQYVIGGAGRDAAYLTGNLADYVVRAVDLAATDQTPAVHGYELTSTDGNGNIYLDDSTEIVHFQDGTFTTLFDMPTFLTRQMPSNGIGTSDDTFFQALTGDQQFIGGAGIDTVYLQGNVQDYNFEGVDTGTAQGVALHALNHSGDLFIDSTTESVHFQNGLYSSYLGMQTFIAADHLMG